MLDAIRALQNEGTRAEVALNFREQGNEMAKAKNWKDAKEFYTKGIAVLNAKEDKWDKPEDLEKEQKMLREAREACYINRALCNLELSKTFTVTIWREQRDCSANNLFNVQKITDPPLWTVPRPSKSIPKISKPTIGLPWLCWHWTRSMKPRTRPRAV